MLYALGLFVWLVGWFLNSLINNLAISRTDPKTECLTILHAATHETELGDHDFCLSYALGDLFITGVKAGGFFTSYL